MISPLNLCQEYSVKTEDKSWQHFQDAARTFPLGSRVCILFLLNSSILIPPCLGLISIHPSIHPSRASSSAAPSQNRSGLLGEQEAEAFLHRHSVSGELVVGGEASRVGRAGGLPCRVGLLLVTKTERKCTTAQLISVL